VNSLYVKVVEADPAVKVYGFGVIDVADTVPAAGYDRNEDGSFY
jgi:hypothetical protein